jgi:aldose 1-epimerase
MKFIFLIFSLSFAAFSQHYTAQRTSDQGTPIVRLADSARGMEVSILPTFGNRAYEFKVHGDNVLNFPFGNLEAFAKRPGLNGIPFLAPWANRIDGLAFWANGKKYQFNESLGNVHGALPIHGLLSTSPLWEVIEVAADAKSAHVTSRLQFWKAPDLMAQWPFAHEYEMTFRLADGVLEVTTTVKNLSTDPMPLAIGFHPYYQIPNTPRDQWTVHIPARKHIEADVRLIPTGELKPADLTASFSMKGHTFDDGFTDLERDSNGRAHFSIESGNRKIEILFGQKFPVAVVYAPPAPPGQTRDFVCFEPMTAITNGINLNHDGRYSDLQVIAPGKSWTESFWVRPDGF